MKIKNHHYKKCSRMITDSHLEIAGNLPGTIPTTEFDNDDGPHTTNIKRECFDGAWGRGHVYPWWY